MKDDKVTNVRLTLAKSLRVMPVDIRDSGEVSVILRTLEDEIETWEGGGGQNMDVDVPKVKVMSTISKILENNAGASSVPLVAGSAKSKIRMSGQQTQGDNGDTRIARTDSNEDDSSSLASI